MAAFFVASFTFDIQTAFYAARHWFLSLGWAGPLVFALIYGCLGVLAAPTGLIAIIAGALFGLAAGSLAAIGGGLLAAHAGFICSRWLARQWVSERLRNTPLAWQIEAALAERGFLVTVFIRLSPLIPFNLTSYILGASSIRWSTFMAASLLGMLPIKLALVWLGAHGQKLLATGHPSQWGTQEWLFYGGGLLATLLLVVIIGWIINQSTHHILQQVRKNT